VRSTHIVGHEHTYVEFDVIRRSDVNQNPAADSYTLTADIPAVGSLLEPHSQLPMDQHDELINQIVQVRHILKGFRRRDPSQKNRSGPTVTEDPLPFFRAPTRSQDPHI